MDIRRGQIVLVALSGHFGKPRPAVVVQSDLLNETHSTISVCLMTSESVPASTFRVTVEPSPDNGLRKTSQVMADKIMTVPREKIRGPVGTLGRTALSGVEQILRWTLALA
jgi:mRNA interferase MazF